ncbi:MAG: hypothetical protein KFB95_02810 [Simkaniaceae bacterium]|nr:MAG: hypothetical protein KFB95_02810 [Simkaniaceae bacterium]
MANALQSATAVSQQATQSVKIPSFWDRLVIKFCALFSSADSKPFDKIADQFSQGYKPWDRTIDPVTVKGIEDREVAYKAAIKEVDSHPTPLLTSLHDKIKLKEAEVDSLKGKLDGIHRAEEDERSYYHGSCYTDDYPQQQSRAEAAIRKASSELAGLRANLQTERREIAKDRGIVIPKSGVLNREVRMTVGLYRRVSSSIIQEQRKHPNMSVSDIAVLSMPLFLSNTEQKNLERFLQAAQ